MRLNQVGIRGPTRLDRVGINGSLAEYPIAVQKAP